MKEMESFNNDLRQSCRKVDFLVINYPQTKTLIIFHLFRFAARSHPPSPSESCSMTRQWLAHTPRSFAGSCYSLKPSKRSTSKPARGLTALQVCDCSSSFSSCFSLSFPSLPLSLPLSLLPSWLPLQILHSPGCGLPFSLNNPGQATCKAWNLTKHLLEPVKRRLLIHFHPPACLCGREWFKQS